MPSANMLGPSGAGEQAREHPNGVPILAPDKARGDKASAIRKKKARPHKSSWESWSDGRAHKKP
jgi:hypothetical protein